MAAPWPPAHLGCPPILPPAHAAARPSAPWPPARLAARPLSSGRPPICPWPPPPLWPPAWPPAPLRPSAQAPFQELYTLYFIRYTSAQAPFQEPEVRRVALEQLVLRTKALRLEGLAADVTAGVSSGR